MTTKIRIETRIAKIEARIQRLESHLSNLFNSNRRDGRFELGSVHGREIHDLEAEVLEDHIKVAQMKEDIYENYGGKAAEELFVATAFYKFLKTSAEEAAREAAWKADDRKATM